MHNTNADEATHYLHTYIHAYMQIYIHTYTDIYIYIHACIHTELHTCGHAFACIHRHRYAYDFFDYIFIDSILW